MEKYDLKTNGKQIISFLEELVTEGKKFGLNLDDVSAKISCIKDILNNGEIRVALIGRFSDGKTSLLAGLLGKKLDDMKIGIDETSDELVEYKVDGIDDVVFVDTPGLFGSKEKERDGETIRLSEITEKFISEAHIIIYVCDAINPIKNSHENMILHVLKKYNKLPRTIFVLNQMDLVCDLTDDLDYRTHKEIKEKSLIKRLKDFIDLTDEEAKQVNSVCVSADPDGRGVENWLKDERYSSLSRICQLRNIIKKKLEKSSNEQLHGANIDSITRDALLIINNVAEKDLTPKEDALVKMEDTIEDVKIETNDIYSTLITKRRVLRNELENERKRLLSEINCATVENINSVFDECFGTQDSTGNFTVLNTKVEGIFHDCLGNTPLLDTKCQQSIDRLNADSTFIEQNLTKIGSIKVDGKMVLKGRDLIAKGFKFKPWGAIKLANKINVGISILSAGLEAWQEWKKYKMEKKLNNETKPQLKQYVEEFFRECNKYVLDNEKFFELFDSFQYLKKSLTQKEEELEIYKNEVQSLRAYQEKVERFKTAKDIVDAQFENLY